MNGHQERDKAAGIPENQVATALKSIYQLAGGSPYQPVSIASLDHPIGTTAAALRPVLAHLEEHGWVIIVDGGQTVLLTDEGVAAVVHR